jgi:hypothetical protein
VRTAWSAAVRSDTFVGSASHAGGGGILSNGAVEALHCSRTVGVLACGTLGAGSERGSRRLSEAAVDAGVIGGFRVLSWSAILALVVLLKLSSGARKAVCSIRLTNITSSERIVVSEDAAAVSVA